MPIVSWQDEYSVNVKIIDEQHKQLLELVNRLHASVEACVDKALLRELLVELLEFTRHHFSTEDKLMKEHDYPDFLSHHREHAQLLRHMAALVNAVSNGQQPTFYSDYDVSSDWALAHIAECDKSLGEFLNAKGVS